MRKRTSSCPCIKINLWYQYKIDAVPKTLYFSEGPYKSTKINPEPTDTAVVDHFMSELEIFLLV
jgi:hypothetical protein